jgi:D-alanyl-D-alanine carboxypeptidase
MTAVVVLQLARQGALELDAPVSMVRGDVGYADRSLRALLAHDGGLPSEPAGPWWERTAGVSFDDLASANDGSVAAFAPHERFHYSNLGYALLGEVVARATGGSWWEAVRARVLDPLGMSRTTYLPQEPAATGRSVHPYDGTLVDEPATDTGAMAPAGQVWATAADLAAYAQFLLTGHPEVLPADELARAATPQAGSPDDGLGYAHGLGFQLLPGGSGTLVGHTGSMPGFLAACFVDRRRRAGGVVLANATTGFSPADTLTGLLDELEACEPALPAPWAPAPPVPAALAGVPGVWHWGNTPVVFARDGERLVARSGGRELYAFEVRGDRLVGVSGYHAGEELRAVRRADGSVGHLEIATFVYTRTPYDPEAPVPGGPPGV